MATTIRETLDNLTMNFTREPGKEHIETALASIAQILEDARPDFSEVDQYNRRFLEAMFNGFYKRLKDRLGQ